MDEHTWSVFTEINERRRAVRDFTGEPVSDEDMRAILAAARLAPSSGNLQPYELHWVRDPLTRARVAEACNAQRAAASAGALVIVVARWRGIRDTSARLLEYVEHSGLFDDKAKAYHRSQCRETRLFLAIAPLRILGALRGLIVSVTAHFSLVPFGPAGLHHWAVRSSIFAAQTLLLAAAARGLDSCPMEGFNPWRVAKVLGLPRGVVIPLVIAFGRRRPDARIEPRWRRPFEDLVVVHPAR